MACYETVKFVVDFIKTKAEVAPQVAIICGSGLGTLADVVTDKIIIKYEEIEQFPKSTVAGHAGNLVFGKLGGKDVVVMQGRFHPYEGYSVTLPVRVFKLLGVETLIVTNAAGGLNPQFAVGDMMIIKDHICMPGMTGMNALVGKNEEKFGPRFPNMQNLYTKDLRELAKKVAEELEITEYLKEGIYCAEIGPTYETHAEARFLRMIGADAVGMSTAHETTIAKHAGMKVFAMSLITNMVVMSEDSDVETNHEEVLAISAKRAETMKSFVERLVECL
nr:purine nucleoside phosphorylase [Hymenolepis microstoma]CDS35244.2 purine nucleoside phosphorylase [Hymenolepis microstoma]